MFPTSLFIHIIVLLITNPRYRYWYRTMFDEHFPPYCAGTVERWTPTWSKQSDPSGR